jgi:hypothetical protein
VLRAAYLIEVASPTKKTELDDFVLDPLEFTRSATDSEGHEVRLPSCARVFVGDTDVEIRFFDHAGQADQAA